MRVLRIGIRRLAVVAVASALVVAVPASTAAPVNSSSDSTAQIAKKKSKRGKRGARGKRGPRGPQGPQGQTGKTGKRGRTGKTGSKGATGSSGVSGYQLVTNAQTTLGDKDITATCPSGKKVVGGGYDVSATAVGVRINSPASDGSGWRVVTEGNAASYSLTVNAVCATAS